MGDRELLTEHLININEMAQNWALCFQREQECFKRDSIVLTLQGSWNRSDSSSEIHLVHLAGLQSNAFLIDYKISCQFGFLFTCDCWNLPLRAPEEKVQEATVSLTAAYKNADAAIAALLS